MLSLLLAFGLNSAQESTVEFTSSQSCSVGITVPTKTGTSPFGDEISGITVGQDWYPGTYITNNVPGVPSPADGDLIVWFGSFDQSLYASGQVLFQFEGDHNCVRRFGDPFFTLGASVMSETTPGFPGIPMVPLTNPALPVPNEPGLVGLQLIVQPVIFSQVDPSWVFGDGAFRYTIGTFNTPVSEGYSPGSVPCVN
jgi:hypothetical protein